MLILYLIMDTIKVTREEKAAKLAAKAVKADSEGEPQDKSDEQ